MLYYRTLLLPVYRSLQLQTNNSTAHFTLAFIVTQRRRNDIRISHVFQRSKLLYAFDVMQQNICNSRITIIIVEGTVIACLQAMIIRYSHRNDSHLHFPSVTIKSLLGGVTIDYYSAVHVFYYKTYNYHC